jgi:hypothetical protein
MNIEELEEGPSPQDLITKLQRMNPNNRLRLMEFIKNMDTFESFDSIDTFQKMPSPRVQI